MRGLKYVSWGDNTGYAIAAKSYVRALIEADINITWAPMMPGPKGYEVYADRSFPCQELDAICNRDIEYDTVLIHTVPEYYSEWIAKERRLGRRILGYTVWELERLPDHWPAILNQLDGVIVPCRWNVEVFRNSGVTVPIHVVPHLSQFERMEAVVPAEKAALQQQLGKLAAEQDRFVFYTIGFWSHRKAPYLALEAYWNAFSADDRVLMVIKTCAKDITQWHRHWKNGFRRRHPSPIQTVCSLATRHPRHAPVIVIADEDLSDAQMLALHEMGDCFVSLTRTEGWGLGAFEAARLGKPIVMTGYGGQLDFLDPELAYLVDYQMVSVHEPTWSTSYRQTDQWAEPSVQQAACYMRQVLESQVTARERGARLAQYVAREFSSDAVVARLIRALSDRGGD
jgi:glycosyltransferase involved in cell wall biosynthesis